MNEKYLLNMRLKVQADDFPLGKGVVNCNLRLVRKER